MGDTASKQRSRSRLLSDGQCLLWILSSNGRQSNQLRENIPGLLKIRASQSLGCQSGSRPFKIGNARLEIRFCRYIRPAILQVRSPASEVDASKE